MNLSRRQLVTGLAAMLLAPPDLLHRKVWALGALPPLPLTMMEAEVMAFNRRVRVGWYFFGNDSIWWAGSSAPPINLGFKPASPGDTEG